MTYRFDNIDKIIKASSISKWVLEAIQSVIEGKQAYYPALLIRLLKIDKNSNKIKITDGNFKVNTWINQQKIIDLINSINSRLQIYQLIGSILLIKE